MKKNLNNILLGISLVFIFCISIYFIVQKMKNENINHYMDLLGSKLMAMLPEENEKSEVAQLYDQFKQQVEEKKVAPEEVEKITAEILNLENMEDSLRMQKVEQVMVLALGGIPDEDPLDLPDEPESKSGYLTGPGDEEKWRKLGERLREVYVFEENLKKNAQGKEPQRRRIYEYDDSLHIIIDRELRQDLLRDSNRKLVESIKEMEKQKWLIWKEGQGEELEKKMGAIEDSLRSLQFKIKGAPDFPEIIVIAPGSDSIKIKVTIPGDSLHKHPAQSKLIR